LQLGTGLNKIFQNLPMVVNAGGTLNLNNQTQFVSTLTSGGGVVPGAGRHDCPRLRHPHHQWRERHLHRRDDRHRSVRPIGAGTLTLESPLTYSGPTLINGGAIALQDDATMLNTSAIDIDYATLTLNNNSDFQTDITNRIGDTTPINLRGGSLTFDGRALNASSETFGAISSLQGAGAITINTGNSGTYFSADVTMASLARSAGSTVNFATAANTLGSQGDDPRLFFTTAPTLTNEVLAPWAIVNATDFASYNPVTGLGAVGGPGFKQYDAGFGTGRSPTLSRLGRTTRGCLSPRRSVEPRWSAICVYPAALTTISPSPRAAMY